MTTRTDLPFVPVPFTDRAYYAPCCKPYTRTEDAERTGSKVCPICEERKPLEDFDQGNGVAGRHSYCRPCRADYYLGKVDRSRKAVAA